MRVVNNIYFFVLALAFITRVFAIEFFGDIQLQNEWGIILKNMTSKGIFGFREVDETIFPNLFMPPLYPFFYIY